MKKNEKIIVVIGVITLLVIFIWLFFIIFDFEGNKVKTTLKITESEIDKLYSKIPNDTDLIRYSIYNGYKTTYENLNDDYIVSQAYLYLEKDTFSFNIDELENIDIKNKENILPLYKVKYDDFIKIIKNIFNNSFNFDENYFEINAEIKAYYDEKTNYFYFYKEKNDLSAKYYIFREKESIGSKENGNVLIINDYFLKCDIATTLCYNDNRLSMPNRNVNYVDGKLTKQNKEILAKYQHTYRWDIDHYYWQNSEIIEN